VSRTVAFKLPATPIFPLAGFGDTVVLVACRDIAGDAEPELVPNVASAEKIPVTL
jgi:hypothetical protein